MDEQRVRVEVDGQGVAEVALVRADKMNALDHGMFEAIIAAIARLRGDAQVRAVVLHGEGRAFCAGLDKSSLQGIAGGGERCDHTQHAWGRCRRGRGRVHRKTQATLESLTATRARRSPEHCQGVRRRP